MKRNGESRSMRGDTDEDARSADIVAVAAEAGEPEMGVGPGEVELSSHSGKRSRRDLLTGDIRQAVFWLALPVLGEQLLNSMVAWNDTYLAGHISATATAAVGFGAYISWLISLLFSLVGIGATAIVARNVGAGNRRDANIAANQAVVLSVFLGAVATVAIYFVTPAIVSLLDLSADARPVAVQFIRVDIVGYVAESLTFIGAACLRGAGNTRTPMKLIGTVNIVNALATWLFTRGIGSWAGFGTPGIAWGTAAARNVGGLLTLYVLLRGSDQIRLSRDWLLPRWSWMARMLRIGLPASLDSGLMWAGHFVFLYIITHAPQGYSKDVMFAAHIVGIRIESLSYLPAFAWSVAASTLVGQNLGANQPDRALACAREARNQALVVLLFAAALFFFGAPTLFGLLSKDPKVIACGAPALRALALLQPFVATLIVYLGALRGAGDTLIPMMFTIVGMIGLRIPIAYLGGRFLHWGLLGVWTGMFADLIVRSTLMAWRLRGGGWRKARV